MISGPGDPNVNLYNPDPADDRVHPNALFFYVDTPDSPLFFMVGFGHLLNLTRQGPTAFENGAHIRTMPFHVDSARVDKPVLELTPDNFAAIKAAYKLPPQTPLTLHVREQPT